jgi:hypothetical protein
MITYVCVCVCVIDRVCAHSGVLGNTGESGGSALGDDNDDNDDNDEEVDDETRRARIKEKRMVTATHGSVKRGDVGVRRSVGARACEPSTRRYSVAMQATMTMTTTMTMTMTARRSGNDVARPTRRRRRRRWRSRFTGQHAFRIGSL